MSDLDDLEEIDVLLEREKCADKRLRAGKIYAAKCIARNRANRATLQRFGKGTRRKAPPITLAGPKS